MWNDEMIGALRRMVLSKQYTQKEMADRLSKLSGYVVSTNAVAGKINRLRAEGDLKRDTYLRKINPEPRPLTLPPPDRLDEFAGGNYRYCQWPTANGKCGHVIGARFPGVVNYCTAHQIKAVSPGRREKVVEFHAKRGSP